MILLQYKLRTLIYPIKENSYPLKKTISRRYLAENMTDADYGDDLTLLANTPAQAESFQHILEQAARGIGLSLNSNETVNVFK